MSAAETLTETTEIEQETAEKAPDRAEKGSLKPVLDIIPAEAYENPTWKGLAYFGRDLVMYGLIIAGLIVFNNPFVVIALWVLSAMVISGLFIVAHDAAHGALFSSKRLNRTIGTIAMLPSCSEHA
jgi:omega-6 fatty acid desaturase (delta-12 desaturase)